MKKTLLIFLFALISIQSMAQTLSLVKDVNIGMDSSNPHYLTEFNGKIYFVAGNGTNFKLYSSDGTTAGTQLVGPTAGNGVVWDLTVYNNNLYFTYDDGVHGLELWKSNGTTAGTAMLKDIYTGTTGGGIPYSSLPRYFTVCNGLLFFQASTAARAQGLWVTNGTEAGTQMLGNQYSDPFASVSSFVVLNNKIYFEGNAGSGYGMWSSDGTTAGTQLVKPGIIGSPSINHVVFNNRFYFQNDSNGLGGELWASDGTDFGTVMIKDINTVSYSSDPQNFFADGTKVYFVANDGTTGRELWSTDGTTAGTQLVKDINPGTPNSVTYSSTPNGMVAFNNEAYTFGYNGTAVEMVKTNGTLAGTTLIKTLPGIIGVSYSYVFNGKIYFVGYASVGGSEYLYESDGTASGTIQINPIVATYSTSPNGFNLLGFAGNIYLPASFGSQGFEFCRLTPSLANEEFAAVSLNVYPNPAQDNLFVTVVDELVSGELYLTNLQGQILRQWKSDAVHEIFDVSDLAAGIYILSIQKENQRYSQKIIKK
ncbi:ELWxxDGT repeat protein [Flavobacterium sp. 25HG05S-40]|uniref:ELWxxDGT repeat protein n=1 Tax=Flavobacterium sp. 25HG05S-40 TaxID=3458682 RepID=UPI0040445CCD